MELVNCCSELHALEDKCSLLAPVDTARGEHKSGLSKKNPYFANRSVGKSAEANFTGIGPWSILAPWGGGLPRLAQVRVEQKELFKFWMCFVGKSVDLIFLGN